MIFMKEHIIFIGTAKDLVQYAASEIKQLGFSEAEVTEGGVALSGTLKDIIRLNLSLRCVHHVFMLLKRFHCGNIEELYKGVTSFPWENYIDTNGYFSVFSNVENPTIRDQRIVNLKCKDAVVDRLRRLKGERPDSGSARDKTVLYIYWKENSVSLYLDSSGETLSKREYRKIPLQAPLQETLAAALVFATGYSGRENFINPMCGSGTLAIEAALIAKRRAPGILRHNFGFMHIKDFDHTLWEDIKRELKEKEIEHPQTKIIATDIRPEAVEAARKNAERAGVSEMIDFSVCDFSQTLVPRGKGFVVLNPEYGIRMGESQALVDTYAKIGDFFKRRCQGYTGFVLSAHSSLLQSIGLKPSRKISFHNANLACRFCEYFIY